MGQDQPLGEGRLGAIESGRGDWPQVPMAGECLRVEAADVHALPFADGAFDTVVDHKTSVTSTPGYVGTTMGAYPGYGYGRVAYSPYGYGRYGGYGYGVAIPPQQTVRSYDEGTLIIDFLDHRDKELFWRGSFSAKLSRHPTPQSTTEKIQDAVKKILAKFPPE